MKWKARELDETSHRKVSTPVQPTVYSSRKDPAFYFMCDNLFSFDFTVGEDELRKVKQTLSSL